jgi:hypothetical protein
MQVTVYPTKRSACLIAHPTAGPLKQGGSVWPHDGFTCRMIKTGMATETVRDGYNGDVPKVRTKTPPAPRAKPTPAITARSTRVQGRRK